MPPDCCVHGQSAATSRTAVTAMAYVVQAIGLTVALYASPLYWKQDYHMSALTASLGCEHTYPSCLLQNYASFVALWTLDMSLSKDRLLSFCTLV
ncbi:hypothetical protein DFH09DRAFT_1304119 [Mycena vulgaris]|nr:hypothetical protein DFH09DRAFT_1304119 [Mycena vulgaris]